MGYPQLCPETKLPFVIMDDNCCSSCGLAHGISALNGLTKNMKLHKCLTCFGITGDHTTNNCPTNNWN